jgi:hypothetical protein
MGWEEYRPLFARKWPPKIIQSISIISFYLPARRGPDATRHVSFESISGRWMFLPLLLTLQPVPLTWQLYLASRAVRDYCAKCKPQVRSTSLMMVTSGACMGRKSSKGDPNPRSASVSFASPPSAFLGNPTEFWLWYYFIIKEFQELPQMNTRRFVCLAVWGR